MLAAFLQIVHPFLASFFRLARVPIVVHLLKFCLFSNILILDPARPIVCRSSCPLRQRRLCMRVARGSQSGYLTYTTCSLQAPGLVCFILVVLSPFEAGHRALHIYAFRRCRSPCCHYRRLYAVITSPFTVRSPRPYLRSYWTFFWAGIAGLNGLYIIYTGI